MSGERRLLTKDVFLAATKCGRMGWLAARKGRDEAAPGYGLRFRFAQGNLVGAKARELFAPGLDLQGPASAQWVEEGRKALSDARNTTLFEVPIQTDHAMARPDVLQRLGDGWRLVEVKSGKASDKIKADYVEDVAYTLAVARAAGLRIARTELALVNPEWRADNHEPEIVCVDVSAAAGELANEFQLMLEPLWHVAVGDAEPDAELQYVCKKCDFYREACFRDAPEHPVFELPRITARRVNGWIEAGVTDVAQVSADEKLSGAQQLHWRAIRERHLVVEREGLGPIETMKTPVAYLDFETVALALPPFPGIAPYDAIPTQYSLHRNDGGALTHTELLLDPAAPDLEMFVRHLLHALDGAASIVVYSTFEKQRLEWLAGQYPEFAPELEGVVSRLVDLLPIVQKSLADPGFHGSSSIKQVLPVMVRDDVLTYKGLAIANGDEASGIAGLRAMGRIPDDAWNTVRGELLAYCAVDTMAMVRLHEAILELR